MLKKFLCIFSLTIVFVFGFKSLALAQTSEPVDAPGLESCFNYYDYGKVDVNLATGKQVYKPGETAQIIGTVINKNSFPLVDVVIYSQLRRTNTGNVITDGHHLLESKQITQPMNFLAGETRFIKTEFPLLETYPNGGYQLQSYVVSTNGFHYAGRPFLEEDFAGTTFFEIKDSSAPLLYFNPSSINVNSQPYTIRGVTQEFGTDVLSFSALIVDKRPVKTEIPVTVKFYSFEDTFESYLIEEQKTVSKNGRVDVQFRPPSAGAYVMVMRMETPAVSEIKFRFAQINGAVPALRINDLGVTAYPPAVTDKAYVCVYSPAPQNSAPTSVLLEVFDKNRRLLAKNSLSTQFPSDVMAISVPLSEVKDNKDFWVKTTIKSDNQPDNMVENHYTCSGFGSSPKDLTVFFKDESLSVEALNSCGQKISNGGYIESLRIKNTQGAIVKEFYNLDQINQNIVVQDLPKGDYTAEVKSGQLLKTLPFQVSGIRAVSNIWIWVVGGLIILLAGAGVYYYRIRNPKLEKPQEKI